MHELSNTPYPSDIVSSLPDCNFLATRFHLEAYPTLLEAVK